MKLAAVQIADPTTPLGTRRRSILKLGVVSGIGIVLATANAGYATPANDSPLTYTSLGVRELAHFEAKHSRSATYVMPLGLTIVNSSAFGVPVPDGLSICYDRRLVDEILGGTVVLDGVPVGAVRLGPPVTTGASVTHSLGVPGIVPPAQSAGLVVVFDIRSRNQFPNDSIDDVVPFTTTVADNAVAIPASPIRERRMRPQSRQAWGYELFAGWNRHSWKGSAAYDYMYPASVLIKSAGPFPVPAGTVISLTVDPQIVDVLHSKRILLNGSASTEALKALQPKRDKFASTFGWRIAAPLQAGSSLELLVAGSFKENIGELANILHPRVSIDVEAASMPNLRTTDRLGATNTDSVWRQIEKRDAY
ncbi:hypothetical protein ABC337_17960 [Arthrobacter sp. 1P04PC]|uniref:hypothetical protein n=1 Tax=unclassified Arthrobacter TaxID=235627 RepID=UPI0039A208F9